MRWNRFVIICSLATTASIAAPPLQPIVNHVKNPVRPKVIYAYSVIDPHDVSLSVKAFPKATPLPDVRANIRCRGVAITGGFSRRSGNDLKPLGLVRTANGTLSNLTARRDGGVLTVDGGDVRLTRLAAWRAAPSGAGLALQSHPLLVFDGKVDEPLNDRRHWNRLGLGILRDGRIVLIGGFTPRNDALTLREFAQDAITILGPGLVSLLNMDGGPSAFMLWPEDRLIPSQGSVTTYLCAERK